MVLGGPAGGGWIRWPRTYSVLVLCPSCLVKNWRVLCICREVLDSLLHGQLMGWLKMGRTRKEQHPVRKRLRPSEFTKSARYLSLEISGQNKGCLSAAVDQTILFVYVSVTRRGSAQGCGHPCYSASSCPVHQFLCWRHGMPAPHKLPSSEWPEIDVHIRKDCSLVFSWMPTYLFRFKTTLYLPALPEPRPQRVSILARNLR